jgi:hypothetical protein
MARVEELLELLNTLILSSMDNTIPTEKTTLQFVVTCLQISQEKAILLQTQTRLLHDALERKNLRQHSELVLVLNLIFEDDEDDDVDSNQETTQEPLTETTPDSSREKTNFLIPNGSSDLGRKSGKTSIELVLDMKRMSPFIIQIT